MPVSKKGCWLWPCNHFFFVDLDVNILTISFTGVQIGLDIALARIILSWIFDILIGLLMAWIFRKDNLVHAENSANNLLFDVLYPKLRKGILMFGDFGDVIIPRLLKVNDWVVVVPAAGTPHPATFLQQGGLTS